jgi:hypothetical protein
LKQFKLNGKEASVDYDKAGHKLAIEIEIKESECTSQGIDLYFNYLSL